MTRYISLRVFLVCLVACAAMALGAIWFQGTITAPLYFHVAATLFIMGLASFLIWFSSTIIAIRRLLQEKTEHLF